MIHKKKYDNQKRFGFVFALSFLMGSVVCHAEKIFASGFQEGTYTPLESTNQRATDIRGFDSTTGFDWVDDLEADGRNHYMNYVDRSGGHDPSMLGANIVQDPDNPENKVLYTWQKDAEWQSGGFWSRVQMRMDNINFKEVYLKMRVRFGEELAVVNNKDWRIWCSLFSINPSIDNDYHLSYRLIRDSVLSWGMRRNNEYEGAVEYKSGVPIKYETWQTIEFYAKAGDDTKGRVWFAVDGQTLFDFQARTSETNDFFDDMKFFKLYGEIVDVVTDPEKGNQGAVKVWYDDFELWDSRPPAVPQISVNLVEKAIGSGSTLRLHGTTIIEGRSDYIFSLYNHGNNHVTFGSPILEGEDENSFLLTDLPATLEPGVKKSFLLQFKPGQVGEHKAKISLPYGEGQQSISIDLIARGRAPGAHINYPLFDSVENLQLVGNAVVESQRLNLVPPETELSGAAWHTEKVDISEFTTTYRIRLQDVIDEPGEGVVFSLQPHSTSELGGDGSSLGFRGVEKPVFGVYTEFSGTPTMGPFIDSDRSTNYEIPFTPKDGSEYEITINYKSSLLNVNMMDLETGASTGFQHEIDLKNFLGSENAYAGFTASTGGKAVGQTILSWSYTGGDGATLVRVFDSQSRNQNSATRNEFRANGTKIFPSKIGNPIYIPIVE